MAIDWEDTQPKPKAVITVGEDLRTLSVAELKSRIEALEAEIVRVRQEMAVKQARAAAADALFKS